MESLNIIVLVFLSTFGVLNVSAQIESCVLEITKCLPENGVFIGPDFLNRFTLCNLTSALDKCSKSMPTPDCKSMVEVIKTEFSELDKYLLCSNIDNTTQDEPDCSEDIWKCILEGGKATGVTDIQKLDFKNMKEPFCKFRDGFQSCQTKVESPCKEDLLLRGFSSLMDDTNNKEYKCGCSGLAASLTLLLAAMFFILQRK